MVEANTNTLGQPATHIPVRNVSTFNHPMLAIYTDPTTNRRRAVRVNAIGDQEGKSPVYLMVDETGASAWDSLKYFRLIDPIALPPSTEALFKVLTEAAGGNSM